MTTYAPGTVLASPPNLAGWRFSVLASNGRWYPSYAQTTDAAVRDVEQRIGR
jgi:hypothetical protein